MEPTPAPCCRVLAGAAHLARYAAEFNGPELVLLASQKGNVWMVVQRQLIDRAVSTRFVSMRRGAQQKPL